MKDIHVVAKRAAKAAKCAIVSSICSQLDKARKTHNDCIPHGLITKLLNESGKVVSDYNITCHDICNCFKQENQNASILVPSSKSVFVPSSEIAVLPSSYESAVVPSSEIAVVPSSDIVAV